MDEGVLQGTLGGPGNYAPTVGLSLADGQALVASIGGGAVETAALEVVLSEVLT